MKDFLATENARNRRNARLYCTMLHLAYGKQQDVLIGHHLNFQEHGVIDSINEVPSADTLIFDHEVMHAIFGNDALEVMLHCAKLSNVDDAREKFLAYHVNAKAKAREVPCG